MKKRPFLPSVLVLFLLAALLVACGGQEPEPTPTVVIVGPQVRPTEVMPATPTLRSESPAEPPVSEEMVTEEPAAEGPAAEEPAAEEPAAEGPAAEEQAAEEPVTGEPVATEAPPTEEPTPTTAPPPVAAINGMSAAEFIVMPREAIDHIRAIFAQGQAIGRNPDVFSILGDSLIATPQSLAQWDNADYTLGDFAYLQETINKYAGSFGHYGPSVRVGLHSWSVFDPLWADKEFCQANENVLDCEIRLNNPSIMLVFLGSNDSAPQGGFKANYKQVVDTLIANGIVPILATKADRFEGPDNANNTAIREVAQELQVPLLEFDRLADTLPGRGLGPDGVHLTFLEPLDYTSPGLTAVGYPTHNLATLMILDQVRRTLAE
ncbi:MAG: SGNH/GDSL hydrolase family protein [Candidatus Promineifilaceae bacterium]